MKGAEKGEGAVSEKTEMEAQKESCGWKGYSAFGLRFQNRGATGLFICL